MSRQGDIARRQRIEAYWQRLYGYALSLVENREDAQDLVQTGMLKALSARHVPEDEPAYRAWLFKILRNAFLDARKKRVVETIQLDEDDEPAGAPEVLFEQRIVNVLAVQACMAQLKLEYREVLALVDIAGFTYDETAGLLAIPVGTVMSRLSRARTALMELLLADKITALPMRLVSRSR